MIGDWWGMRNEREEANFLRRAAWQLLRYGGRCVQRCCVRSHLDWLADTVKKRSQKRIGGHAPEHYAELLGSILRRGALRDLRPERVGEGER